MQRVDSVVGAWVTEEAFSLMNAQLSLLISSGRVITASRFETLLDTMMSGAYKRKADIAITLKDYLESRELYMSNGCVGGNIRWDEINNYIASV